jgi:hypothetical protein
MINPYESPRVESTPHGVTKNRPTWPLWAAGLWIVILFLFLPSISYRSSTPDGTFLWLKIVTTIISMASARVLIVWPVGWGRLLTVPLVLILCVIQYTAWVRLP